jgi:NitT/TauT family transport system substrate-binding protein
MKKITVGAFAATVAIALAGLTGCAAEPAPAPEAGELTTVRVANLPVAATMILNVAVEQGFLEENGIDAQVTESSELGTFIPALGNQYDIVMTTPSDFLAAATKGFDLVSTAGGWADGAGTYSKVASSIEELAGLRLATNSLAGLQYAMLQDSLAQAGVEGFELVQVPFAAQPDQLIAGQVDAATVPEPFASALEAEGYTRLFTPIEEATGEKNALTGWFSTSREFADANPEVLEGWAAAFESAVDWIEGNPDDFRAFVQEQLELDPAVAEAMTMPTYKKQITAEILSVYLGPLVRQGQLEESAEDLDLSAYVLSR